MERKVVTAHPRILLRRYPNNGGAVCEEESGPFEFCVQAYWFAPQDMG